MLGPAFRTYSLFHCKSISNFSFSYTEYKLYVFFRWLWNPACHVCTQTCKLNCGRRDQHQVYLLLLALSTCWFPATTVFVHLKDKSLLLLFCIILFFRFSNLGREDFTDYGLYFVLRCFYYFYNFNFFA